MGQNPHITPSGETGLFARGFSRVQNAVMAGAQMLGDVLAERADARAETYGHIVRHLGGAPQAGRAQGGGLSGMKPLRDSASVFQRGHAVADPRAQRTIAAIEAAMQAREKTGRSAASHFTVGK